MKRLVISTAVAFGLAGSQAHAAAIEYVTNLNDSGVGSLRRAVSAVTSGGTIILQVAGTISLTSGQIYVNKPVTINGNAGIVTLDAGKRSRCMATSGDLVAKNLSFANGVANALGGALKVGGNLTLSSGSTTGSRVNANDTFTNAGGGIYVDGNATLNSHRVASNQIYGNNGVGTSYGGGIAAEGTLTLNNSTITGNSISFATNTASYPTDAQGGGAYSGSNLYVTGGSVTSNIARGGNGGDTAAGEAEGGGLYSNSTVSVSGLYCASNAVYGGASSSSFAGNANGGCLSAFSGGSLSGSTIYNNLAQGGNGSWAGDVEGGGVYFYHYATTLKNNVITYNRAIAGAGSYPSGRGGGISVFQGATSNGNTIQNNYLQASDAQGGGIYLFHESTLTNSTITSNIASGGSSQGGGVWNFQGLTYTGSNISGNSASAYPNAYLRGTGW